MESPGRLSRHADGADVARQTKLLDLVKMLVLCGPGREAAGVAGLTLRWVEDGVGPVPQICVVLQACRAGVLASMVSLAVSMSRRR